MLAESDEASTAKPPIYRGRFAPSPTGPLHFGSLLTAVAGYAQAKVNGGEWLIRIEDIDPPREQPEADKVILNALEAYGFEPDGPVTYQSAFAERHEHVVKDLINAGKAYPCSCSRRDLADASRGPLGTIYPGTCRAGCDADEFAIRLRTTKGPIHFIDALQGFQSQRLQTESGDFVIKRRDGLIAYHLAVVIDDHDQGVSEIVRGIDLLDSTPLHIWVQQVLGLNQPSYAHIPVAVNLEGHKLSKLTGATGLSTDDPRPSLVAAVAALRQNPPSSLQSESIATIWDWTLEHWQLNRLTGLREIPSSHYGFG